MKSVLADPKFAKLQMAFGELAPAVAAKDAGKAATLSATARALQWPGLDSLLAALEKRVKA